MNKRFPSEKSMVKNEWFFYYIREDENLLKMFKTLLRNNELYFEVSDGRMWTGKPMVWDIAVRCNANTADWLCDWIEENK